MASDSAGPAEPARRTSEGTHRDRSPTLTDRGSYALFVAMRRALETLPVEVSSRIGSSLGSLAWRVLGSRRKRTLDNLERVFPDMPEKERRSVGRRSFARIAARWSEQIALSRLEPEQLMERLEPRGREHFERAWAEKKGLMVMSGHWDAFDLAPLTFAHEVGGVHIIVQAQSNPLVRRDIQRLREGRQVYMIERGGSVRPMVRLLRTGQAVGLVFDQRVQPWDGILIPFLGHLAWTSPAAAMLAKATGAPLLPIFCTATSPGRYRFEVEEPILASDVPDGDDAIAELTMRYLEPIERRIREDPTGWMWMTRRWQRTWRHSWPESLVRLRREAEFETLDIDSSRLGENERAHISGIVDRVADVSFLEAPQSLVIMGETLQTRRSVAREAFRQIVEKGWPGRRFTVIELLERLDDPSKSRARFLASLDHGTVLLLEELDDPALGTEGTDRLSRFLDYRLPRGTVLATASRDPSDDRFHSLAL